MDHITNIKGLVKYNRTKLIKFICIVSLIFSLVNLIFSYTGVSTLKIVLLAIFNYICGIYFAYFLKKDLDKPSFQSLSEMMKIYIKDILIIGLIQILLIVIWMGLLIILSKFKIGVVIFQPLSMIAYVLLNYMNFCVMFDVFEGEKIEVSSFTTALKDVTKNKKTFVYLMLKIFSIIIVGGLVVYLVNIFAYAPQIDATLKAMKKFDDTLINPYFSTNLSNFIQSFGAQIISGLILIWIGNTSIELKH